ncbi:hypothetical protein [Nostoc sp.]|uniref:hypothetical protein n=1 Tax=Nostoc sp. TaxID=1180 RepID=UPI002FF90CEB
MANITVNDIKPTGVELFADSESFMEELSNDEFLAVLGGNAEKIWPLYNTKHEVVSYVDVP